MRAESICCHFLKRSKCLFYLEYNQLCNSVLNWWYRAKDLEEDGDRLKDAVGDFLRYNHDFTDDNRRSISQIIDENA